MSTVSFSNPSSQHQVPNALAQHASPYLAMHGFDPVDWLDWRADVLQKAQTQNKLILISSGYFACHWCHVMQAETYQNQASARLLNQHFISVKLDRELHPELDGYLMEFAKRTNGQAGWPLHVVLTPEGLPLNAFLYEPNADFNQRLTTLNDLWRTHAQTLKALAKKEQTEHNASITQSTQSKHATLATNVPERINNLNLKLFAHLSTQIDDLSGGLTGTSKFPEAPLLNTLVHLNSLPSAIEEWVILTLEHMQTAHLFDHINGGFYRYSIDPEWQTPHFEKMTYTNALLASVYLKAGARWQRPDFVMTAQRTLNYLHQHLLDSNTQLYQSSQSAIDAQGQEGGNYLFNAQQLAALFTPTQFKQLNQAWSLHQSPPYALGWHPAPHSKLPSALWNTVKMTLQNQPQSLPSQIPRDAKGLLSWNGYVLSALSNASQLPNQTDLPYAKHADALAAQLTRLIMLASPPRAVSEQGTFLHNAGLDDYAAVLQGLQDWQASHKQRVNLPAHNLTQSLTQDSAPSLASVNQAIAHIQAILSTQFYSEHGWQDSQAFRLPGQKPQWILLDEQLPSAAGLAMCAVPDSQLRALSILENDTPNLVKYASTVHALNRLNQCTERQSTHLP
ncbi:thioredoxin domain-containing protein [Thiomicrorhabdus aquaedulcis]|uniref:thioredoxin domain-containing protein n=1 Tax=Thiomicrorhabdus aquaedulcis TaxID=2211106 RepID=UPI0015626302|nr:DUF255 domain-containing protein [Thiomicrorhabdus aquaedulcis]